MSTSRGLPRGWTPRGRQCIRSECGRYFVTKDSGLPEPYTAWRKTDGLPVMLGTAETAEQARAMCEESER